MTGGNKLCSCSAGAAEQEEATRHVIGMGALSKPMLIEDLVEQYNKGVTDPKA